MNTWKPYLFAILLGLSTFASAGKFVTLDQYKAHAVDSDGHPRCMDRGATAEYCSSEIKYALELKLIDQTTANWGNANGYYPIINRHGEIDSICKCGCFAADTLIKTATGDIAVNQLSAKDQVITLSSAARMTDLSFQDSLIKSTTSGAEASLLYHFTLSNASALKLTQHHGVLLSNGRMTTAKELTIKDELVTATGEFVQIDRIERIKADGAVYNFEVKNDLPVEHIVIANGILVGEVAWQNQYTQYLNQITLRM